MAASATWQYLDARQEVKGPFPAAVILLWNATYRTFHDEIQVSVTHSCVRDVQGRVRTSAHSSAKGAEWSDPPDRQRTAPRRDAAPRRFSRSPWCRIVLLLYQGIQPARRPCVRAAKDFGKRSARSLHDCTSAVPLRARDTMARVQVRTIAEPDMAWRPLSAMRPKLEQEVGHPPGSFGGARAPEPSQPLTPVATSPSAAAAAVVAGAGPSICTALNLRTLFSMPALRDAGWFYYANMEVHVRSSLALTLRLRMSQH